MSYKLDNYLFIKNILILIFVVILIHVFLNEILMDNGTCGAKIENATKSTNNNDVKDAININNSSNEKFTNTQTTIYFFWASWCPHCVSFKPIFEEFESKVSNNQNVKINKVQCDENTQEVLDYVQKFNIEGFPTVIIVNDDGSFKHYEGQRNLKGLMNILPSDNKEGFTNDTDSVTVYNFNTSWCGYSRKFQPVWEQFCDTVKNNNIETFDIKCDDETNDANQELCKKYNIRAYPTVIIVRNTDYTTYDGPRTVDDLVKSVNTKKVKVNTNHEQGKTIVYNFNTEWCGFSKMFQPVWNTFSNSLKESDGVVAIDVKCDNDSNAELCSRYNIEGYPTVLVVNDSGVEMYNGPRTVDGLKTFLRIN